MECLFAQVCPSSHQHFQHKRIFRFACVCSKDNAHWKHADGSNEMTPSGGGGRYMAKQCRQYAKQTRLPHAKTLRVVVAWVFMTGTGLYIKSTYTQANMPPRLCGILVCAKGIRASS